MKEVKNKRKEKIAINSQTHYFKILDGVLSYTERSREHFTQRHAGGTGVRVDPEGKPGQNHDQQGRRIHTHHVKPDLPPEGEDDFHTCVVPFPKQTWEVWGSRPRTTSKVSKETISHFYLREFHKVNSTKKKLLFYKSMALMWSKRMTLWHRVHLTFHSFIMTLRNRYQVWLH